MGCRVGLGNEEQEPWSPLVVSRTNRVKPKHIRTRPDAGRGVDEPGKLTGEDRRHRLAVQRLAQLEAGDEVRHSRVVRPSEPIADSRQKKKILAMAMRRKRPPLVYQSEPRCRPYQPMPSGIARKTRVKMNSANNIPTETAPLRATAMPIWVKNATTARKRVIPQSVLGSVRKKAIIRAILVESLHPPTSAKNTRT